MSDLEDGWYSAWRESWAWSVPASEEGMDIYRMQGEAFKAGYLAAIKECKVKEDVA